MAVCGVIHAVHRLEVPVQVDAVQVLPSPGSGPVRVGTGQHNHASAVQEAGISPQVVRQLLDQDSPGRFVAVNATHDERRIAATAEDLHHDRLTLYRPAHEHVLRRRHLRRGQRDLGFLTCNRWRGLGLVTPGQRQNTDQYADSYDNRPVPDHTTFLQSTPF